MIPVGFDNLQNLNRLTHHQVLAKYERIRKESSNFNFPEADENDAPNARDLLKSAMRIYELEFQKLPLETRIEIGEAITESKGQNVEEFHRQRSKSILQAGREDVPMTGDSDDIPWIEAGIFHTQLFSEKNNKTVRQEFILFTKSLKEYLRSNDQYHELERQLDVLDTVRYRPSRLRAYLVIFRALGKDFKRIKPREGVLSFEELRQKTSDFMFFRTLPGGAKKLGEMEPDQNQQFSLFLSDDERIHEWFSSRSFRKIEISNHHIVGFPPGLRACSLESLTMHHTQVRFFGPECFEAVRHDEDGDGERKHEERNPLAKLKRLDFSTSGLHQLSPQLPTNQLIHLNLSNTNFTNFPKGLKLPAIEVLDCSHTPLSEMPDICGDKITALDLSHTYVPSIPVKKWKNLQELYLSNTPCSFPRGVFPKLQLLFYKNITARQGSQATSLYRQFPEIQCVELSNSPITSIGWKKPSSMSWINFTVAKMAIIPNQLRNCFVKMGQCCTSCCSFSSYSLITSRQSKRGEAKEASI
jgi:hypothetical protein